MTNVTSVTVNVNANDNVIAMCEAITLTLHSFKQFIQVHTDRTLSEQTLTTMVMWRTCTVRTVHGIHSPHRLRETPCLLRQKISKQTSITIG